MTNVKEKMHYFFIFLYKVWKLIKPLCIGGFLLFYVGIMTNLFGMASLPMLSRFENRCSSSQARIGKRGEKKGWQWIGLLLSEHAGFEKLHG